MRNRQISLFDRIILLSIFFMIFIPTISSAAGVSSLPAPERLIFKPLSFEPPKTDRIVLENGLVLFSLEDNELPLINITVLIRTGSMYDPQGEEGLAELTGKVMKTGGVEGMTGSAVDEALESMSAPVHVSVNRDSATFSLSCLSKDIDKALDIFSRILMKPVFEEAKLTLAKELKIGELRRIPDDPQKFAFREFGRLIHEGSPRGRLATSHSINNIHREDLSRHHRQFYHPERIMISISGDISRKDSESIVNRYFGSWMSPKEKLEVPPLPHPRNGIYFIPKDLPQSVIIFGWIVPSKNDPQFYPFEIIDFLTGSGGFRSRMFQKIRTDRGLAYSVGSFYTAKSDYGLFGAYAITKSDSTAEVITLIRSIIREINEKSIPSDELGKIKQSINNRFIFSFTSADKIVFQQMMTEYEDLPKDYLTAYRDNIEKVALSDIQKAAAQLDPARAVILIIGNETGIRALPDYEAFRKIEVTYD